MANDGNWWIVDSLTYLGTRLLLFQERETAESYVKKHIPLESKKPILKNKYQSVYKDAHNDEDVVVRLAEFVC